MDSSVSFLTSDTMTILLKIKKTVMNITGLQKVCPKSLTEFKVGRNSEKYSGGVVVVVILYKMMLEQ